LLNDHLDLAQMRVIAATPASNLSLAPLLLERKRVPARLPDVFAVCRVNLIETNDAAQQLLVLTQEGHMRGAAR